MRLVRVLLIAVLCLAGTGLLAGCCCNDTPRAGCRMPKPCCIKPCYWWKGCCPGDDCAPIGDPCDCCDSRG